MRWLTFLVPALLASSLLWGWLSPGRPEAPPGVTRGEGAGSGLLALRPGETAAGAVRFLRTFRSDPPPPTPPPAPVAPPPAPPPPPPDVAVLFKQALLGVSRDPLTGAMSALVRDPGQPGPQIGRMKAGDVFGRDGWRIRDITDQAVTLEKGRETRVVHLFG